MHPCQPHSFFCQIVLDIIDNHLPASHYSINSKLKCNLLASDKVALRCCSPSVNSNILKDDAMQSIFIVFAFRGWGTERSLSLLILFHASLSYFPLTTLFRVTWRTHTTADSFSIQSYCTTFVVLAGTTLVVLWHEAVSYCVSCSVRNLVECWCTIRWI